MGRKKNPFLSKTYAPKTFPYIRGRIYDYDYICFKNSLYTIYLEFEEIKKLDKEDDICQFSLDMRRTFLGEEFAQHDIPVDFTEEEFINFKRTKIIEHLSNE